MKILMLCNAFPPNIIGGGEYAAYSLACALAKRRTEVSVLTMAEPEEPEAWNEPAAQGFKLFRLHFPRAFTPYEISKREQAITGLQYKLWQLKELIDPRSPGIIKRVLAVTKPDHVDIQTLQGFGFNSLALFGKLNLPITWYLHDSSLACNRGMFSDGRPCNEQCIKCKLVSTLTAHFIRKVRRLAFISPSRATLATVQKYNCAVRDYPGFVVQNIPDEISEPLPPYTTNKTVRILFAGRLHEMKGLSVILEALDPLAARFDFRLTILGRGPLEEEVARLYGDKSWVTLGGFVSSDQVMHAVAAHDLVCTPSIIAESFGRTTALALQLGVPVFGSNLGATTELVQHEKTGLLIEPGNVEAWRKAFERIFSDPGQLASWRQNAKQYTANFSTDCVLKKYETAIHYVHSMQQNNGGTRYQSHERNQLI